MQAILCAILAGLCWGVGEIFTKSVLNTKEIGPLGTAFVRAAVTLPLALLGFLVAQWVLKTETQTWWRDMRGVTQIACGHRVSARCIGIAERTPKRRTS